MATAATFDSVDLFGEGPRRFVEGVRGAHVVARAVIDPFDPSYVASGMIETVVRVEGVLVAGSEGQMDARIETILGMLESPARVGVLTDGLGHEWEGVGFTRFERTGVVGRGRVVTQAYRMEFRKFTE